MKQELITNIKVKDNEIRVMRINNEEYISLTDLAKYKNYEEPSYVIKEWRDNNPDLAKTDNIIDYADLLHLVILNNLENVNAELIEMQIPQNKRLMRLNTIAQKQMIY